MPPKIFGTLSTKKAVFQFHSKLQVGLVCANILNTMFTESFFDASNISYPFIESVGHVPMDAILVDPIGIMNILDG